jgi:ribonuclease VapC
MIAVDTSALVAILLREPEGLACGSAIATADRLIISAVTMTEAMVVAQRKGFISDMQALFQAIPFETVEATAATALRIAEIYARWGKGAHPAKLNLGDCFSYDVAKQNDCPLLYVGEDFARTDIASALRTSGDIK